MTEDTDTLVLRLLAEGALILDPETGELWWWEELVTGRRAR